MDCSTFLVSDGFGYRLVGFSNRQGYWQLDRLCAVGGRICCRNNNLERVLDMLERDR